MILYAVPMNHRTTSSAGVRAIILMGGSGERFGSTTPKQFHRLAGKKIYLHTLETFLYSGLFEEIILVCPPLWMQQIRDDLAPYSSRGLQSPLSPLISLIEGGASRQESSFNGLLFCS